MGRSRTTGVAVDGSFEVHEELGARHLRVCGRFGEVVGAGEGRWSAPSPCESWSARDVVEHVIGFHDVLLLRPLGAKPSRPRDDVAERWRLTYEALDRVLARADVLAGTVDVPAVANNPPTRLDARRILPMLTQDVLVHTWDLARAVGADDRLDPEQCAHFYGRLPADPDALVAAGKFAPPVSVGPDADVEARLLARLGRDPTWEPPG